ncbi:hypothetical protein CU665_11165 [Pseudomonas syringae pv. actinidifoliorum]|nr:hypothetical protein [Pseudomonas syringae pv. actinidifoliorum]NAT23390.1 hypothetical protein [Pseudomonas syringae pv. actinidifoliorum]NAT63093.1 hypothetical protein [Pseudomonas syringae pv. actinidifoliorum]
MTCKDCPSFLKIQMKVLCEGVGKGSLRKAYLVVRGVFEPCDRSILCRATDRQRGEEVWSGTGHCGL